MNHNKPVNEIYRREKGRLLTNVIVGEPSINEFGFSVTLHENIEGVKQSFTLRVTAAEEVSVTKDTVACIIAALVFEKYRNILFNFDIGENTLKECARITGAVVNADTIRPDEPRAPRSTRIINTSGGVDSTALALLCPDIPRASIGFSVPAEDQMLEHENLAGIDRLTVTTNASEFLFPHYSAGYYNLCALLHADSKGIANAVDGRLLTDSLRLNMMFLNGEIDEPYEIISGRPLAFEVYGVKCVYPFIGLTRAGTQQILHNLNPALYQQMMAAYSQITPSAKRALKLLIQSAVTGTEPEEQLADVNFYAPYLVKKLGPQIMADTVDGAKLDGLAALIAPLNLDFYERYDRNALRNIPEDFAAYFLERLETAGIGLYTDEDYAERAAIMDWLAG